MAADEALAEKVREFLNSQNELIEKKMFGGLCFMLRGHMICGIVSDRLMLRVGPESYEKVLKMENVAKMNFTGTPLKGFVFISKKGLQTKRDLTKWLKYGLVFNSTLPIRKTSKPNLRRPRKGSNTLLKDVKNFGPVTLAEFFSMGVRTLEQLKQIGFEDMCRKYVTYYPERLNANAFLGIVCAIEETVWTKATPDQRAAARSMAKMLKIEYGKLPARFEK